MVSEISLFDGPRRYRRERSDKSVSRFVTVGIDGCYPQSGDYASIGAKYRRARAA